MATLRKVYNTGSATVIGIPPVMQELSGLRAGATANIEVTTPSRLLMEMGVAPMTVQAMMLPEEHFIVVRKHQVDP